LLMVVTHVILLLTHPCSWWWPTSSCR